jgi:hypothetical protein
LSNHYIDYLLRNYITKGIVIDTNLFILYLIGNYDSKIISKFKRTESYSVEDFYILRRFILSFRKAIITPNIMTEVSNLLESLNRRNNYQLFLFFHKLLKSLKEEYIESVKAAEIACFQKFGLTDSSIYFLAKEFLILTDDLPFYHYLETQKLQAINFNHLRSVKWFKNTKTF